MFSTNNAKTAYIHNIRKIFAKYSENMLTFAILWCIMVL